MEEHESHAVADAFGYALDDFVFDLVVGRVAPPDEDVGVGEDALGQPVLWLVERRRARIEAAFLEGLGDRDVDAVGVDLGDRLVLLLVDELVPDRHASVCHKRGSGGDGIRVREPATLPWITRRRCSVSRGQSRR